MNPRVVLPLVAACGALVGGCGHSNNDQAANPGPQAVAVAWVQALDSHDGATACSLMTPASVTRIERPLPPIPGLPFGGREARKPIPGRPRTPCPKLLSEASGPQLPVASTTAHGKHAVVTMKDKDQLLHRLVLESIDGRWLVDFARSWGHPFGTD
jgi:hypothetical protein